MKLIQVIVADEEKYLMEKVAGLLAESNARKKNVVRIFCSTVLAWFFFISSIPSQTSSVSISVQCQTNSVHVPAWELVATSQNIFAYCYWIILVKFLQRESSLYLLTAENEILIRVWYVCHFTRFEMIYAASIGQLLSVLTTYKLKLPSFKISHLLWKSNGKPTCRELKRHSSKTYRLLNRRGVSWQRILSNGKVFVLTVQFLFLSEYPENTPTNTSHIWFILQQDKSTIVLRTMEYCSNFSISPCKKPCRSHQFTHKVTLLTI